MSNHTQKAPTGKATFSEMKDRTTGIDFPAIGQLAFLASGVSIGGAFDSANRLLKVDRVALSAVDTAGGVFSWQNPESTSVIACVLLDVTTVATGACTIDVGYTATGATTSADNLMDGLDVHSAAGLFTSLLASNRGTNGVPFQKAAAGKWINGSKASGASAGIVGYAYIVYFLI